MKLQPILRGIRNADRDYKLIEPGDSIAVALSGGKDSMVLFLALSMYQKFQGQDFKLYGIHVDVGFEEFEHETMKNFAKEHNLKILYVSDLIQYRLQYEKLIALQSRVEARFLDKPCLKHTFVDHIQHQHIVYVFAQNLTQSQTPLVKFHTIQKDYEYFEDSLQAHEVFMQSVEMLQEEGGYLICLDTKPQQDLKTLGIGAQILRELGVEEFRLLHSSAESASKAFSTLSGFNLNLTQKVLPHEGEAR